MIGVYLHGRMGNQMFQYAFALNTARKLNTSFFLDDTNSQYTLNEFFEVKSFNPFLSKVRRKLFRTLTKQNKIEIPNADPFIVNQKYLNSDKVVYNGYFQSEKYFSEHFELIRKDFTIKKDLRINARQFLNIKNDKPLLALHVRRADYLHCGDDSMGGKDLSLPLNYYESALAQIGNLENYNIVFVTDDVEYVKNNFSGINYIISSDSSAIIDFQILMQADQLIVANSSFSWWAARLNSICTQVFAPKFWLGFRIKREYPVDVVPEKWKQIECL